jgi:hypothetical protein
MHGTVAVEICQPLECMAVLHFLLLENQSFYTSAGRKIILA